MALMWVQNSAGTWTLSGTGTARTAVIFADLLPAQYELTYQLVDKDNPPRAIIRSSQDGRTCLEVGVVGANIVIRKVLFADVAGATVLGTAAHLLASATSYFFRVRGTGTRIEVFVNGSATAILDVDDAGLINYPYFGIVGDGNNQQVSSMMGYRLVPVTSPLTTILCAFAGGELWASLDRVTVRAIARNAVTPDAIVGAAEYGQKLYIVDGGRGYIYDPSANNGAGSYGPWIPSAGALPGGTAGTNETTATLLVAYADALWASGTKNDPNNYYRCKRGDPLNWNTGDNTTPDRAIAGNEERQGRLGRPIVALCPFSDTSMLFVCDGQMWRLTGDPSFGGYFKNVSYNQGGIGPDCAWARTSSDAVVLTPEGLVSVGLEGEPIPISKAKLQVGIEVREDKALYRPIVIEDQRRSGLLIFIPLKERAVGGANFWWDGATKGPFPEKYPVDVGPMAACLWEGELVMLTRTGYVVRYDDSQDAEYSDIGTAIEAFAFLTILNLGGDGMDTELSRVDVIMAASSDAAAAWTDDGTGLPGGAAGGPVLEILGAATAEELYTAARPWIAKLLGPGLTRVLRTFRANCIGLRIRSNAVGKKWSIDDLENVAIPVPQLTPRTRVRQVISYTQPTTQPTTGTGTGTGTSFDSGSGSGSGTSIPSGGVASGTGSGTGEPPPGTGTGSGSAIGGDEPIGSGPPIGPDPPGSGGSAFEKDFT